MPSDPETAIGLGSERSRSSTDTAPRRARISQLNILSWSLKVGEVQPARAVGCQRAYREKMRTLKEAMPKGHCEKGRAGPVVQPAFALPRRIAVQCARGPAFERPHPARGLPRSSVRHQVRTLSPGRCGVPSHEGVAGAETAPAQGKAFPFSGDRPCRSCAIMYLPDRFDIRNLPRSTP